MYQLLLRVLAILIRKRTKFPIVANDYIELGKRRLSNFSNDFLFAPPDTNRLSLDNLYLVPRVCRDVSSIDVSCNLLEENLPAPIILAPTGANAFVHPRGELAVARGAGDYLNIVSTMTSYSLEKIASSSNGPLWFQLYVQRDLDFTKKLINRALNNGYRAICISVDAPVPTRRGNWSKYKLPSQIVAPNLKDDARQPVNGIYSPRLNPAFDWNDLKKLIHEFSEVDFVVKGIMSARDASLAVEQGAKAIVVSNHGSRQIAGVLPSIKALPRIVNEVDVPVLYDGGITSGIDILKAISLGADAVLVGKIYLCALGLFGEDGVRHLLGLLKEELEIGMALCGINNLKDLRFSGITEELQNH